MQDTDKKYELEEMLAEANRLREADPNLSNSEPFNARTVYYYVQEGLLPGRSGRRGPGTRYSQQFIYRLLVIRRLQKEELMRLSTIREVMERIDDSTLKNVALGVEPLEVRPVSTRAEAERAARQRADNTMLLRADASQYRPDFDEGPQDDANADYSMLAPDYAADVPPRSPSILKEASGKTRSRASAQSGSPTGFKSHRRAKRDSRPIEHKFPLGDTAQLVIRQPLTGKQMRQLENIAQLIADILEDE